MRGRQNAHLRCTTCHTCSECGCKKRPEDFKGTIRICNTCARQADEFTCSACSQTKVRAEFTTNVLENAQRHLRLRVCKSCQDRGYSPKDTATYSCKNGCQYGHLKFAPWPLWNHKNNGAALICRPCIQAKKTLEHHDLKRAQDIRKRLAAKDAWKCKCGAIIHHEKCPLHPSKAGEVRWEGKNKGVTRDDLAFLAKRPRT